MVVREEQSIWTWVFKGWHLLAANNAYVYASWLPCVFGGRLVHRSQTSWQVNTTRRQDAILIQKEGVKKNSDRKTQYVDRRTLHTLTHGLTAGKFQP